MAVERQQLLEVRFERFGATSYVPTKAHSGDAGFDLYSCMSATLEPGDVLSIPTGVGLEIPQGYVGFIFAQSGLARKNGIALINGVGVVDSNYRGNVFVPIVNYSPRTFTVDVGMCIAQLVILPVPDVVLTEVDTLMDSERGNNGFGSTGL